jgi:hypothetical protein
MPLFISIPDSANSEPEVPLGGLLYNFRFEYNTRDERYRLSIDLNNISVIRGLKIIESTAPTLKYDLVSFDHGQLFVVRAENTKEPVGRDNFGADKPYRLLYLANSEITNL